jgi:hypothetical protein
MRLAAKKEKEGSKESKERKEMMQLQRCTISLAASL